MSDFTNRVMGAIGGGGDDDGDDAANPVSPFAGTNQGGQHIEPHSEPHSEPQELTPVGPGVDDLGNVLKPFTCRKCGVLDHAPDSMIEIHARWGMECLPCRAPWRFKWRRDPDTGERFLLPTPGGGKPRSRLGESERRELELRATELIDLQLRREYLIGAVLKMQGELTSIEPRIVELRVTTIPTAQTALEAIESDPKLEKRQKAADIAHDIGLAIAAVLKQKVKDKPRAKTAM